MNPPNAKRSLPTPGFTLVEVLVVVAVILVLSLLGYSGGRRLINSARVVESTANLRSLAVANATYVADNGVYCPADDQSGNRRWHGTRTSSGGRFDPTKGFLSPYLGKSQQVSICPLLHATVTDASSFEEGTGGYGYNASYIGGTPGGNFDTTTKIRIPQRPAHVTNPGRTVMFTTAAYAVASGLQQYAFCEPPFWDFGSGPSGFRPAPSVHFRANGKALVAWCDGSVTAEIRTDSQGGENPHGGDADSWNLGWFGPEENNGWWNPRN